MTLPRLKSRCTLAGEDASMRRKGAGAEDSVEVAQAGVYGQPPGAGAARVLRAKEVVARTALSRVTLWRLERAGDFPMRRRLSPGTVGWIEAEVEDWIMSRRLKGRSPTP